MCSFITFFIPTVLILSQSGFSPQSNLCTKGTMCQAWQHSLHMGRNGSCAQKFTAFHHCRERAAKNTNMHHLFKKSIGTKNANSCKSTHENALTFSVAFLFVPKSIQVFSFSNMSMKAQRIPSVNSAICNTGFSQ